MPYALVNGVSHYYEWILADESAKKPVMVFVHGWAGSARYWEEIAKAQADQFNCLLYDLRGFGRTSLPQEEKHLSNLDWELESYAHDLAVLLDTLEIDQPIFLNAHSTGASIAVYFLNRYPERVKRAILTCNGIFEYDKRSFETFHRLSGYIVRFRPNWLASIPLMPRIFMARFLKQSIPGAIQRAFMEDYLMADFKAAMGTIYTAVSENAALVMPKEFRRLTVPTLLVSGQYDQIIPAEMGRNAAELSDQVMQVVIPNTSHFPMLEDRDRYLQVVQEFLSPALVS